MTYPCQHCNGHIEFDACHAGESAACPHCGLETKLYVPKPPVTAQMAPQIKPNPPATKPSANKNELFCIRISSRAAVVFFALTTLCLALILVHAERALVRQNKATAILAAQVQQLQNNLQAEKKSEELLAAQIKSFQHQTSQFYPQTSQFQRPQTIIVRPESEGERWQHMGLGP